MELATFDHSVYIARIADPTAPFLYLFLPFAHTQIEPEETRAGFLSLFVCGIFGWEQTQCTLESSYGEGGDAGGSSHGSGLKAIVIDVSFRCLSLLAGVEMGYGDCFASDVDSTVAMPCISPTEMSSKETPACKLLRLYHHSGCVVKSCPGSHGKSACNRGASVTGGYLWS